MSLNLNLFNWYKRYKVTAQDMNDFQEGLVTQTRELGSAFQGAVIQGMDVTPVSGMVLSITAGIATSPTGYISVKEVSENITTTAASANFKRSLIVIRPKLVNNTTITKPTSPFESVSLKTKQDSEFVLIDGTPSTTPDYPSKLAEDVVVCGLRLFNGQTTISDDDIEWLHRETPGRNGDLGQRTFGNDNRLRPFRSTFKTMTVMPSQILGKGARLFSYPAKSTHSIFPKTGGVFTNSNTILDFNTGTITGGDGDSADFTPSIPTAGNSITATVYLTRNDTLAVLYGTQGTRQQCLDAIKSQTTSGAGSMVPVPFAYKVSYVVVTSISGAIADIEVFDARGSSQPPIQGCFDAIVSTAGLGTHMTLAAALADANVVAGSRILVLTNETITTTMTISKANITIQFASGVTFTNSAAGTCFTVAAGGTRIMGARFSGFTTAISISSTFQYNFVMECRFATCTNEVTEVDAAPINVITNNLTE